MPYIKPGLRHDLDSGFCEPASIGELEYVLSELLSEYIKKRGMSFGTCNDIIGVLECAKLELYRRLVAPYEDSKIIENGDVSLYAGVPISLRPGAPKDSDVSHPGVQTGANVRSGPTPHDYGHCER